MAPWVCCEKPTAASTRPHRWPANPGMAQPSAGGSHTGVDAALPHVRNHSRLQACRRLRRPAHGSPLQASRRPGAARGMPSAGVRSSGTRRRYTISSARSISAVRPAATSRNPAPFGPQVVMSRAKSALEWRMGLAVSLAKVKPIELEFGFRRDRNRRLASNRVQVTIVPPYTTLTALAPKLRSTRTRCKSLHCVIGPYTALAGGIDFTKIPEF